MPAWLLSILINLAVKWGVPLLMEWLKKKFPQLVPVFEDYIKTQDDVKLAKLSNRMAKRKAVSRAKECVGIGCPPDLKR